MPAAELGANIVCNIVHAGIVAVSAGHYRLRNGNNVALMQRKALTSGGLQHGIHRDLNYIVALPDYRRADAS